MIDYIQRTARKTLAITINNKGEVIVKAPSSMDNKDILAFVKSKEKWIQSKLTEINSQLKISEDFLSYKYVMFCGKKYKIIKSTKQKEILVSNDTIQIKKQLTLKKEVKVLERFLKDKCIEIVGQRIKYFSNIMQLEPEKIVLNNSKNRWGTCNSNKIIAFNWRIIMLPPYLIDYVIVHELAHLMEMNHSASFWAIVASIFPKLNKVRQDLKKCNFILQQFREIPIN